MDDNLGQTMLGAKLTDEVNKIRWRHDRVPSPPRAMLVALRVSKICILSLHWYEGDQSQISPAASRNITSRTMKNIWLFIAHSDQRWWYFQFSLPNLHVLSWKCWKNVLSYLHFREAKDRQGIDDFGFDLLGQVLGGTISHGQVFSRHIEMRMLFLNCFRCFDFGNTCREVCLLLLVRIKLNNRHLAWFVWILKKEYCSSDTSRTPSV